VTSVARRTHQRANANDAEKKLLDGSLMGGSDFAKAAREQQIKRHSAQARECKQGEQAIAEKRRQARGQIAAQAGTQKKRQAIDDVKIRNAAHPLLRRYGIINEVAGAEGDSAPRKAGKALNQHEIGGIVREKPEDWDQRGQKRAEPQDGHVADEIGVPPPERQRDERSERRSNLEPHVGQVAQLQIAQHEDGEKRSRQICGKGQRTAKHHEPEKIAFSEAAQEHEKSKIAGRIFFVRRLIHAADEIG